MTRLTATEVARSFSAVLNRVAAGEEIEIVRNGWPSPRCSAPPKRRLLSAERFREFLDTTPPVDDEFATDLPPDPSRGRPAGWFLAVLIDTDLLVDTRAWCAGSPRSVLGDEDRAISVITVSELLHGAHRSTGDMWARRRAFVEHVIAVFDPIPITEFVARVHAEVWVEITRRGEAVGAFYLWIAATALAHGLGTAYGNAAEFRRVPGLRVLTPLA